MENLRCHVSIDEPFHLFCHLVTPISCDSCIFKTMRQLLFFLHLLTLSLTYASILIFLVVDSYRNILDISKTSIGCACPHHTEEGAIMEANINTNFPPGYEFTDESICPICFEPVVATSRIMSSTCCSVVFHYDCLRTWLGRPHLSCPIDRTPINSQSFMRSLTDEHRAELIERTVRNNPRWNPSSDPRMRRNAVVVDYWNVCRSMK